MPDDIDRAQDREQQMRADALAEQAHRSQQMRLIPCGACLYCGDPVRPGVLFCEPLDHHRPDESCRADFEREQAARKRNGG